MLNFAELARLDPNTLYPLSQSLETEFDDVYKLIELDDDLITCLEEGGNFYIRGYPDDRLIVCTDNRTYQIKEGETSNSMLVLNNCVIGSTDKLNKDITSSIKVKDFTNLSLCESYNIVIVNYLSSFKPTIGRIKKLLEESTYSGNDILQTNAKMCTLYDLKCVVQLSDQELKESLNTINAVEINGFYRMLDHNYYSQILSHILSFIEENSWPNNSIPFKDTLDTLEELFPRSIIQFVFHKITQSTKITESKGIYALDKCKVCQFFAEDILLNTGKMEMDTFLRVWKMSVPDGIIPEMTYLKGIAIIDETIKGKQQPEATSKTVIYLPIQGLPETLEERLEVLFGVKIKWKLEEIACYVEEFLPYELSFGGGKGATDPQDLEVLLNKYARRIVHPTVVTSSSGGNLSVTTDLFYGPKYPHMYQ